MDQVLIMRTNNSNESTGSREGFADLRTRDVSGGSSKNAIAFEQGLECRVYSEQREQHENKNKNSGQSPERNMSRA